MAEVDSPGNGTLMPLFVDLLLHSFVAPETAVTLSTDGRQRGLGVFSLGRLLPRFILPEDPMCGGLEIVPDQMKAAKNSSANSSANGRAIYTADIQ
jgi:hypothetical protein